MFISFCFPLFFSWQEQVRSTFQKLLKILATSVYVGSVIQNPKGPAVIHRVGGEQLQPQPQACPSLFASHFLFSSPGLLFSRFPASDTIFFSPLLLTSVCLSRNKREFKEKRKAVTEKGENKLYFWRQGLAMYFWLALNSRSSYLSLQVLVENRWAQPHLTEETFIVQNLQQNFLFCLRQDLLKIDFVYDLCVGAHVEVGVGFLHLYVDSWYQPSLLGLHHWVANTFTC